MASKPDYQAIAVEAALLTAAIFLSDSYLPIPGKPGGSPLLAAGAPALAAAASDLIMSKLSAKAQGFFKKIEDAGMLHGAFAAIAGVGVSLYDAGFAVNADTLKTAGLFGGSVGVISWAAKAVYDQVMKLDQ